MILIDANLLIYAHDEAFAQHFRARAWLDNELNNTRHVGIPWMSLLAFLRILTNPKLHQNPLPIDVALAQANAWLSLPNVFLPEPGARHLELLTDLLEPFQTRPSALISDAHLAALALEHDLTLCSADRDFAGFKKIRWLNPLG